MSFGPSYVAQTSSFPVDASGPSFDKYPRQVADVNGDGRADIVGFGNKDVFVNLAQSNGTFGKALVAQNNAFTNVHGGWTSFDKNPRELADVNGDGRADIVGFGNNDVFVSLGQSNGTFGQAFVALNNFYTPTGGGWTSFDKNTRELADVNGDGRADIVGFENNDVLVSLGQSNGTFGKAFVGLDSLYTPTDGKWKGFNKNPRELADVNGDGRADLVNFGDNNVFVSLGQRNGTFTPEFVALDNFYTTNDGAWTSFDKYPRELADVNGDGRADIVGFGDNNVYVSLGQSDGTFGSYSLGTTAYTVTGGAWTSFEKYPRQLGDINGDHRADIIGFGSSQIYVSLSQ